MWNESHRKKSVIVRNNIAKENLFKIGTNPSTKYLKKLLLSEGVKYECVECGNNGTHLGKSLKLHLDHINGNCVDNRREDFSALIATVKQKHIAVKEIQEKQKSATMNYSML